MTGSYQQSHLYVMVGPGYRASQMTSPQQLYNYIY